MMNSADFWGSIHDIIDGGFGAEGLQKLDNYAELFINGRLVYKRFSPFEQHGCATGGATHVVASLLAGAENPADHAAAPGGDSFKRELQRGAQQARVIERWAREIGCWFDNMDNMLSTLLGEQIAEGGENVLRSPGGTIFVVDCDIRLNTPDLRQGGRRELSNEVLFI